MHRHGLDLELLWLVGLWCRLAGAALIRPPAWEPPFPIISQTGS